MEREEVKELLYDRFIEPIQDKDDKFVGIEIEMPLINLSGEAADQELSKRVFNEFIENYGFEPISYDEEGNCISATLKENEDNLSFDCSFNNIEISMGREDDIHKIDQRFKEYLTFLNDRFYEHNHLLSGFGINPQYDINIPDYISHQRYRILGRYIEKAKEWADHIYQHNYKGYGTYASASQVQLDINQDNIIDVINAFSAVEPIKVILFANSLFDQEPDLLCSRDIFWENGPVGLNPHNVGLFESGLNSVSDIIEYLLTTSLFNVSRDGKYIHFNPIRIEDYFGMDEVEGEYYDDGKFKSIKFKPEPEDIKFLRTYKYEDLTFRGTVEFRSCCNQPFSEAMTVAAFHTGLIEKHQDLLELMKNEHVLHHHGYTSSELRRLFAKKEWPKWVDQEELKALIIQVLNLASEGLKQRGKGEEVYLEPLYRRAEKLESPAKVLDAYLKENNSIVDIVKEFARIN